MEHLLPNQRPPIRIPNYQPQPDDDGNITTADDCAPTFATIIRYHDVAGVTEDFDHRALWIEQCRDGRVYNLCQVLLNQFYFGRLYGILGPDIVLADFTVRDEDGEVFLTTEKLEAYLLAWRARVGLLDEWEKVQLRERYKLILEQAAIVLRHLAWFLEWSFTNVPVRQAYPFDNNPLGNTHFACVVLHHALANACERVLEIPSRDGNSLSLKAQLPWLKRRMEREGWCPYTILKLYTACDIDELAYGYTLATVRTDTGDHGACTEQTCFANNVPTPTADNSNVLKAKHVNPECDCWTVHAPIDEVIAILEEGLVPVLRIGTDDGYKLSLHPRRANRDKNGGRYIAISHVWVDGLGSMDSNDITQCQLTRIADRLGKLEATESCGELSIWIDTLCIPVQPKYQRTRELGIASMHTVYKEAYAVIAMDADTLRLHSQPSMEELAMRLCLSAWASRLWTYQEGALNARLLVMTADSIVDVDEALNKALWRERADDKLQHDMVNSLLGRTMVGLGRSLCEKNQLNSGSPPYTREPEHEETQAPQVMLRAIRDRTSSRAYDEAIVIATFLGLDVGQILAATPEQKMAALLGAMSSIPTNVLFALGPRLQQRGLHWAPSTFLRQKGGIVVELVPDLGAINSRQYSVNALGATQVSKLDDQGRGLWTLNPAILLKRLFKYDSGAVSLAFELRDTAFDVYAIGLEAANLDKQEKLETETQRMEDMLNEGMKLAILLPEDDPTKRLCIGVLIEMLEDINEPNGEVTKMVRNCMPVSLTSGFDLRSNSLEVIRKVVRDSFPSTPLEVGDTNCYEAEWIEPRYWLVD